MQFVCVMLTNEKVKANLITKAGSTLGVAQSIFMVAYHLPNKDMLLRPHQWSNLILTFLVEMAEKVLQKLEEQLNCSICLDTYSDPKLLQCFHVYCRQCLVPLVDRNQQGQLGLTCPTCRQVTPVPDRGVAGLQSAFHINRFLEIKESFQKPDNPAVISEGAGPADAKPDKVRYCLVHEGKALELYCETCGELICYKCVIKDGKHHDHDYEELDQAFERYTQEITSSLEPMEKQVAATKITLAQLDARCGAISDQRTATVNTVHITFGRIREILSVKETTLIGQIDRMTQGKLKDLAVQRDEIETTLAQQSSCLHFMMESLKTGNEGDVLMMKPNTVRKMKELTIPLQPEVKTEADIVFSASADMTAICQNYGQVFSLSSPDPSKCHVTGKGTEVAIVGEKSTALLQAISFEGALFKKSIKSLDCEVLSTITGAIAKCGVERKGENRYEISYRPTIKGRHQLQIKVDGQSIRGSPFGVAVKSTVEKLGTRIQTIHGVDKPWGVAVNQKGEVVVSEWGTDRVSVFGPCGEKLRSFGSGGSGQGRFVNVREVAVDGEGNILVVDSGNHCIQKFTPEGQFLASVGTRGHGQLQFESPIGIVVNVGNGKSYVTDGNRIQVLNSDLTFSSTFGKYGDGKGHFKYPTGIACDNTGEVYVADTNNHHIQVFTAEGKFVRMFGRYGHGRGELFSPYGIAINSSNMVYISEGNNCRVSVFTTKGQFVTSFGRRGIGPGEFVCPRGLAVDDCGVLYVCDRDNNRCDVF